MRTSNCLCSSLSFHTLAIDEHGTLYGFGNNSFGQAGDVSKPHILVPEKIRLVGKAAQVASGSDFSLVLTEEGKLFSFGANQKGQLGVGHTRASSELCLVSLDGAKAVSFACGPQFAVVVTDKGSVFGWGSNGDEQLRGLERGVDQISPRRLDVRSSDDDPIVRVACGFAHVLALTRAGRVLAWGRNKNHQLGHTADSTIEVALFDGFVHKAVAIACGAEHSFVMTEMGRLFGFGSNAFGQLGISSKDQSPCKVPTEVTFFADEEETLISGLSCGAHHSVILTDDGRVFACGWNEYGQLGIAASRTEEEAAAAAIDDVGARWLAIGALRAGREFRPLPSEISGFGGDRVVAVGCGREHSFAVTDKGSVFAWGFGGLGQLGSGTLNDAPQPVRVVLPSVQFRRIGTLSLERESLVSVVRSQALYLQKQLRLLEQVKLTMGSSLSSSSSSISTSSGGDGAIGHQKRSGTAPAKHKKLTCQACQKHLKKGLHFCNHCGHKVESSASSATSSPDLVSVVQEKEQSAPPSMVAPPPVVVVPESAPKEVLRVAEAPANPQTPKPPKLLGNNSSPGSRSSGAKLPKMSSLQQTLFEMPSPMPISKLAEEEASPERRSSLDTLQKAKVVSSRLSGREDANVAPTSSSVTKVCAKCGMPIAVEERALGPDGKHVHIKCLSK